MSFDRACPNGNHMVDGHRNVEYFDCEIGDVFQDYLHKSFWEVVDIDDQTITMKPLEDQTIMVTYKDLGKFFMKS